MAEILVREFGHQNLDGVDKFADHTDNTFEASIDPPLFTTS